DSFQTHRASLAAAIDSALELGSSIQKTRDDNQSSFSALFGEEDEAFDQRKVSYPDERPWERIQELKYEKDTMGFYVTGHPLDSFEREIERYTTGRLSDYMMAGSAKDCLVGVSVVSLREIMTKRGDRMAFATFEDGTEQVDAVIFSDVYLENEAL